MSTTERREALRSAILEFAEKLVDILEPKVPDGPTLKSILHYVELDYGIKRSDILGESKDAQIVEARHVAMRLCRDLLKWSYPAIGRVFGRDHTTVMAACNKIQGPSFHLVVECIKERFQPIQPIGEHICGMMCDGQDGRTCSRKE